MAAMMSVVDPGDKVIVFSPFYENYGADTILCGAEPIYVPLVPQTDDWQSRPEMLWNCRRPFRWWAFFLVGGIGSAMVAPFVWRIVSRLRNRSETGLRCGGVTARWGL